MSVLVVVDYLKLKSEMKHEIRESKKLNNELRKELKNVTNSRGDHSELNQQRDAQSGGSSN
jgi:hypothetical protein